MSLVTQRTYRTVLAAFVAAALLAAPASALPKPGGDGGADPAGAWFTKSAASAKCTPADPVVSVNVGSNVYFEAADPDYGKVAAFACLSAARSHGLTHAQPPPPVDAAIASSPIAFPVTAAQFDSLRNGTGGQMRTDVRIDAHGALTASTNTHEMTALHGYHGHVMVMLVDASNKIVWASPSREFGVDGTLTGTSDRTDAWSETVPTAALGNARGIAIFHWSSMALSAAATLGSPINLAPDQVIAQLKGVLSTNDYLGNAPVQALRKK